MSDHLRFWAEELHSAMDQMKRPLRVDPHRTQKMLADAGLVDVKQEVIHLPVNGGSLDPYEIDVGDPQGQVACEHHTAREQPVEQVDQGDLALGEGFDGALSRGVRHEGSSSPASAVNE